MDVDTPEVAGDRAPRSSRRNAFVAAGVMAATGVALAGAYFPLMFNRWANYDDEGVFVVSLRLLVNHHGSLYTDVWADKYGPFYYMVMTSAYHLLHMQPTLANGRWIVLVLTTLSAGFFGASVWRVTKNLPCSLLCEVASFLILIQGAGNEPMHPGSLGVLLIAIIAFELSSYAVSRRTLHLVAVGGAAGALTLTKLNSGGLVVIAVVVGLIVGNPNVTRWLRIGVAVAAALAPVVLVLQNASEAWVAALIFVVIATLAAVCVGDACRRAGRAATAALLGAVAGAAVVAVVSMVYPLTTGTSFSAVLTAVFIKPLNQSGELVVPANITVSWIMVVLTAAGVYAVIFFRSSAHEPTPLRSTWTNAILAAVGLWLLGVGGTDRGARVDRGVVAGDRAAAGARVLRQQPGAGAARAAVSRPDRRVPDPCRVPRGGLTGPVGNGRDGRAVRDRSRRGHRSQQGVAGYRGVGKIRRDGVSLHRPHRCEHPVAGRHLERLPQEPEARPAGYLAHAPRSGHDDGAPAGRTSARRELRHVLRGSGGEQLLHLLPHDAPDGHDRRPSGRPHERPADAGPGRAAGESCGGRTRLHLARQHPVRRAAARAAVDRSCAVRHGRHHDRQLHDIAGKLTHAVRKLRVVAGAGIPAGLYLVYVFHYAVNVPYSDDWNMLPLVEAALHGRLGLHDLWMQYGDTRLFVAKLVFVLFAYIDHFNIRLLLLFSAALLIAAYVLLLFLLRSYLQRELTFFPVFLVGVVWFSLADLQNALWSFQVAWYLATFFFIATIFFLQVPRRHRTIFFGLGIACGVAGSFSIVQGFVVWPVGLICVLWNSPWGRRTYSEAAVWIAAALITVVFYWHGFDTSNSQCPAQKCGAGYGLTHPHLLVRYVVVLIGNVVPTSFYSLHPNLIAHELIGTAVALAAIYVVVQSIRERRAHVSPLPLLLIAFGVLFDLLIVLGRFGAGPSGALNSDRYTMPNLVLLTGIVVYACAHLPAFGRSQRPIDRREWLGALGFATLLAFVLVQCVVSTGFGIRHGRATHQAHETAVSHHGESLQHVRRGSGLWCRPRGDPPGEPIGRALQPAGVPAPSLVTS